jgi:hypothetical protein
VLAVVLALALAAGGWETGSAQETVTIRGIVVNGTGGAALPPQVSVLLLVSGPAGGLVFSGQTSTGPDGRFQFEQVPNLEGTAYKLSVEYGGIAYSASLSTNNLSGEVRLTVYEPTGDVSSLRVTRQVLVIGGVDEKNREISAVEFVLLSNSSDRTFLPDLADEQQPGFLRFSLPPSAAELSVGSALAGGDIVSVDTGFGLTSAVVPGEHTLDFSFRFPYRGDSVSYRQDLHQGAGIYQVLVPERLASIGVAPLQPLQPVTIDGASYRVWEGSDFEPGQGIVLELTNLPQPSLAARLGDSVTNTTFWKAAIPGAMGAVLALLLLLGAFRPSRHAAGPAAANADGLEGNLAQRDALIREVALLDERFHQGDVAEADHRHQREGLVARILETTGPEVDD